MAKAGTFGKQPISRDGTSDSLRDYTSLLGVVAAGVLGMSLLCITSAIAISNPDPANPIVLEPAGIVDMAIANLNTVSALTVQAAESINIEATPTLFSTDTSIPASPTLTSSALPTFTRVPPTSTRRPRPTATSTRVPPTQTSIPPTNTARPPTRTNTPIPSATNTPIPPDTNTPIPPPTTEVPPPTTEVPPPTTEVPPPTTEVPPPTTEVPPPTTEVPIVEPSQTP